MKLFPRLPALAGRSTRPQQLPPPAAIPEAPPQAPTPDAGPRPGSEAHNLTSEGSTPSPAPTSPEWRRKRPLSKRVQYGPDTHRVRILSSLEVGKAVKLEDGAVYAKERNGALVRLDKSRLSKKERRRARARQSALEAKSIDEIQADVAAAAADEA